MLPFPADPFVTRLGPASPRQPLQSSLGELVRALLLKYPPDTAAVLVDPHFRVLYLYGTLSKFISQPEGEFTHELLSMVPREWRIALRALVHTACAQGRAAEVALPPEISESRQLLLRAIPAGEAQNELILKIKTAVKSL